ncbi:MAG: hypothetical protein OK454_08460 [Thaumarchaeota archaeon]|nr:hypothetical protein [Nitrososphaerota archaeon]
MERLYVVVVLLVLVESAWALFCFRLPQTPTYFFVFYAGLAAASAVFWIPGFLGSKK